MTEIHNEIADVPGGPEEPEAMVPVETEPDAVVDLAKGAAAADSGDTLTDGAMDGEFGRLIEDSDSGDEVSSGGDADLFGEKQSDAVETAREQVSAALDAVDPEAATDDGNYGGPDRPKPPTGGGGNNDGAGEEFGDEGSQDDDGAPGDSEADLQWERDHAEELALLEQMLQKRLVKQEPDAPISNTDTAETNDTGKADNLIDDTDFADIEDTEEEPSEVDRPEWVETRTREEIDTLKDRTQFTNEDLAVLWKSGDPEAAAAFLTRNSGFFHTTTLRNLRIDEHQDYDDVRQQFEFLVLKALQKYDPEKGAKALSYAGTIAETQLADGREPSRDSVGAQPAIRQIERRIFALDRMLEQSGGHEPLTDAQLARFKLDHNQLAAVRGVEERIREHGYSRLSDDEVISIFHNPGADSSSARYLSPSKLDAIRQHTALTDHLLSADHSAPEYSVWLGDRVGIMSDNEVTSQARPVLEVPQVTVEEAVDDKLTDEAFREILPRALEVLSPKEREILYLKTVEGLSLDKVAERFTDEVEPLSRERVRQIHAGIVDATRYGSARGSLFRHMIARATGYPEPERWHGPKTDEVLQARQILTDALPRLGATTRTILNGYFILDGREATEGQTAVELAHQLGMQYKDVNRTINTFVASISGSLDIGHMRQAMLDFAPVRHPLSDEERSKWGLTR